MKRIICLIALTVALALTLTGCDIIGLLDDLASGGPGGLGDLDGLYDDSIETIDNSKDLTEYHPDLRDDTYVPNEDYYTSKAINLVTEIRGNYSYDRPFILDKTDDTLRIYKNIYLSFR